MGYGQQADGMHATGMHPCLIKQIQQNETSKKSESGPGIGLSRTFLLN